MKNKLLKDLCNCFYTPPELPAQKREIEECHQVLIEAFDKSERRLVLQIIDAKARIVEDISVDNFKLLSSVSPLVPKFLPLLMQYQQR